VLSVFARLEAELVVHEPRDHVLLGLLRLRLPRAADGGYEGPMFLSYLPPLPEPCSALLQDRLISFSEKLGVFRGPALSCCGRVDDLAVRELIGGVILFMLLPFFLGQLICFRGVAGERHDLEEPCLTVTGGFSHHGEGPEVDQREMDSHRDDQGNEKSPLRVHGTQERSFLLKHRISVSH
jgi:hypothetical protein